VSILHGFPKGLLSLVGSQAFGTNPKQLGDVVAPTIDLRDLYLLSVQSSIAGSAAAPAAGFNLCLTVPEGNVWRILAGGGIIVNGAGVTGDWGLTIKPGGGSEVPLTSVIATAANQVRFLPLTNGPIWASAGTQIGLNGSALVGVPGSCTVSLVISGVRA